MSRVFDWRKNRSDHSSVLMLGQYPALLHVYKWLTLVKPIVPRSCQTTIVILVLPGQEQDQIRTKPEINHS